jgi:hypothetical protein
MFSTKQQFAVSPGGKPRVYGGTVTTDGLYTIRTFTSSGNLIIRGDFLNIEYLVVGSGGRGADGNQVGATVFAGGGGGGGQVLNGTVSIRGRKAITIGSGTNTIFAGVVSANYGNNGTSGSGGNGGNSGSGFTGGTGTGPSALPGAGGGAGQTQNGVSCILDPGGTPGGSGGNGISYTISGTTEWYGAGGGGGGAPSGGNSGAFGGGLGGSNSGGGGTAATSYGSGGGGAIGLTNTGGNGKLGIVIVRYLTSDVA